jgi:hypothetical protein
MHLAAIGYWMKPSTPWWPALRLADLEFEDELKLERKGAGGYRGKGPREDGIMAEVKGRWCSGRSYCWLVAREDKVEVRS